MGIQDRDYYRKDTAGSFGNLLSAGSVVKTLVVIYSVVFLTEVFTKQLPPRGIGPFTSRMIFESESIREGEIWRLFTGLFLSNPYGLLGVLCNLFTLWWAGKEICLIYGDREFVSFFLSAGLLGSVVAFAISLTLQEPIILFLAATPMVSLLTLYAMHYPRTQILLFFVLPVPIWICIGLLVAIDLMNVSDGHPPVNLGADLTSIIFAVLYKRNNWRIFKILNRLNVFAKRDSQSQLRVYREKSKPNSQRSEPISVAEPNRSSPNIKIATDEQLEARLDQVLDKVQKQGQASLTDEERELLFRASEIYKKRRKSD
ncbi:rhomboid family intramembrane serine protease [Telmatocola sphagniphila]|uniref:Rhomboid family intramembrane serine protease n=1 Tax=Telmatocola sphagniphila TaxID=1123043 RepID=A0A8E6F0B2_9BACT|nr:rhomboid family intramembrane serine protease [Telmatocola sphagniphila]QVL34331.1 rhomboid family intramembrane serine protease [Telmatocola sphagniphila]